MVNMTNSLKRALLIGAIALGATEGNANVLFSASGSGLSASANFTVASCSISGCNLQVVLTNTSANDVLIPANVLMALFFNLNGVGALTPVSASLGGSTVFYGSLGAGGVGAGWAYKANLVGLPGGGTEGISAAGYSSPSFGPDGNFGCGANCVAENGLNYGLLSAGDNSATGNGGVTGGGPLIKDSVTFLLSGLPAGFSDADLAADLANVAFQYGTALNDRTEPCIGACELQQGAPEPSMPLLLGAGLLAWGVTRRYVERRA